jgi:3-mercaptopropionate dioxygenase
MMAPARPAEVAIEFGDATNNTSTAWLQEAGKAGEPGDGLAVPGATCLGMAVAGGLLGGLAGTCVISYNIDMETRFASRTVDQAFGDLIGSVRSVVRRQLSWAETASLVGERLQAHLTAADLLTSEQRYGDPLSYRCHVLHTESDGSFSVVALVWRPGQATSIHDHVTWCVGGVLQGSEHEDRYLLTGDGWLEYAGTKVSPAGTVSVLVPPGDIHRVRGEGSDTTISLNIYGTDLSRLGSSVRRTYNLPVVAMSTA